MTKTWQLLLIEDNPADMRLMLEALREAELETMVEPHMAYDGEEAFALLDQAKADDTYFDMILLDLNMPKISGKEILAAIKTEPLHDNTKVFVLTNSDYKNDMVDCYNLRADAYIQKPTDFKRLVDFFSCVKNSIVMNQRLSVLQIERNYYEEAATLK
ncbi:MAG: response regulator [Chitinophagales bacterium]